MCFLVFAAFAAGLLDSIAGGGGLFSLPATLLTGVSPQSALGTGKFMSVMGGTASLIAYAKNGAVDWRLAAAGVCFSLAGSRAGAQAALHIDNAMLGRIILALLPLAALLTLMPVRDDTRETRPGRVSLFLGAPLVCAGTSFYDGFFGPASGSLMLLCLHRFLGIGLLTASGTAKALILASNLSSLFIFIVNGKVCYPIAVPMALANIAGHVAGSRLALRKGPKLIRRVLLLSLGLLFISLVWRNIV